MQTVIIDGTRIHIFAPEGPVRWKIWANMRAEEAEELFALLGDGAALFAADDFDWNTDLSPWAARACFQGGEDFAGRADARLAWLVGALSRAESGVPGTQQATRALLGYSLAGLFALWP